MGQVYEVTDLDLGCQVALNVIRPKIVGSQDMLTRFRSEVQAATSIAHPNVCRVHDLQSHSPEEERGQVFPHYGVDVRRNAARAAGARN